MAEWGRTTMEMIVEELQRPVRLDDSFERRVMVRVRRLYREQRRKRSAWATIGATFAHRPGWATAMAAGLVAIATAGVLQIRTPAVEGAASAHQQLFVLVRPDAKSVTVVGDFNNWGLGDTALVATNHQGVWSVKAPVRAGLHRYAFLVNGKEFVADPRAPRAPDDDFGMPSSTLVVDEGGTK